MAILSGDQLIAAAKQILPHDRTASRTSVAAVPFGIFDLAGNPGAGTLAGTSTTAGVVPDDSVAGFPIINAFGGTKGYITRIKWANSVACRLTLYDLLWKGGAYAFNAAVTLSAQPSYSGRVPGGTDFTGLQIWIECVTAFTGNQSIAVTYTNQAGTTGRTTGTIATGVAPTVGRMLLLPLQAGDTGVQKIESVTSTVATVGTFNVYVLRPLGDGRIKFANDGITQGPSETGMPEVFTNSALIVVCNADSTSTGLPSLTIEVSNG